MKVQTVLREQKDICFFVFDRLAELVVLVEGYSWASFRVGSGFEWEAVDILKANSVDVVCFLVGDSVAKLLFVWAWGKFLQWFLFCRNLGSLGCCCGSGCRLSSCVAFLLLRRLRRSGYHI